LTPSKIWGLIVLNADEEAGTIARDTNIFLAQNVRGKRMRLLNDEEIDYARLNTEYLPDKPISQQFRDMKAIAKAQHQQDLKDFIEWLRAVCGMEQTEAHHEDYNQPLLIV